MGRDGTLQAVSDQATLDLVPDRGARAKYITSVCSGSLILGAAGLLKGHSVSLYWSGRKALADFGATPVDSRVVNVRNRINGAGVTAGLDFGLAIVAELRNKVYAECTQLMSEYDHSTLQCRLDENCTDGGRESDDCAGCQFRGKGKCAFGVS
ncbi:DJ-1/PfpI family protein [Pseudomonas sp. F3-2]|uniref:DJ-1/PfpI family protein n=1 Tax=Pseudomonas sp. F3-2 TaxID=3141539 RepID=UPI00315D0257